MRFKDLSNKDKLFIAKTHENNTFSWDSRMGILTSKFDVSERTIRKWIATLKISKHERIDSDHLKQAKQRKVNPKTKRFIVCCAQNGTPVNENLFKNIEAYAKYIKADIHVIPSVYARTGASWTEYEDSRNYWDDMLVPYLDATRQDLHPLVTVLGDLKVLPTALNPLTGLRGVTSESSSIIGHPKIFLESVPVLEGQPKKIMLTTGSVTIPNYSDTLAGYKGEFHHTYGFVVVELDGKQAHIRQVTSENEGSFYDLFHFVEDGKVKKNKTCKGIILGDLHLSEIDKKKEHASLALMDRLQPEHVVLHDLVSGESISHHDKKNALSMYHKVRENKHLVKKEVDEALQWLKDVTRRFRRSKFVVARSNHDDFLDRWIINNDWRNDPANALEYARYLGILLKEERPKLLPYLIGEEKELKEVICLDTDESYKVADFEVGCHGHLGANGSRGSLKQFSKLNTKIIVGHYHTCERRLGSLSVGTSTTLRLPYTTGPSSWQHCDAIIHQDGKAQQIIYTNYKYTTL